MAPIIMLALGGAALYFMSQSQSTTPVKSVISEKIQSGLLYKCNSIEVIDKVKFKSFVKNHAEQYLAKNDNFNTITYVGELLEKLNENCYKKYVNKSLTKNEKIIIVLLAHEAVRIYASVLFNKDFIDSEFQNTPEFKEWIFIRNNGDQNLMKFIDIEADVENKEFDLLEDFFELNGNKFPVK